MIDPTELELRHSRLKQFGQSAAHYLHACQFGDDQSKQTPSTLLGSATHSLVLGGRRVLCYEGRRAGGEWKEFADAHPDALILSATEYEAASAMANAVTSHPDASALLARATNREQLIRWTMGGRACRGTPDAFGDGVLLDLKTTRCAEPSRFVRDAQWSAYHSQLAFYREGIRLAGLPEVSELYLIAVENKAPHPVVVLELTTRAKSMGHRLWSNWFGQLQVCESSGSYPGYTQSIVSFDVDDDEKDYFQEGEPDL